MKLPQIRLSQTFAQIGLRIEKPKQRIEQPKANMQIRQTPARLEINRKPGRLLIDQTKAWEEANLKGISALAKEFSEEGRRLLLEGIARRAEEGRQLAAIERDVNAIVELARKNGTPAPKPFNITFIPSYGSVKFHYMPSRLDMEWHRGGTTVRVLPRPPIHEYTPGSIEVYMRQRESLTIDVVGLDVDAKV